MQGSKERVKTILRGGTPDRPPLYDLLRNDAVVAHFAGEPVTVENGVSVVFRAYAPAIDATRPLIRTPNAEREETLPDGRRRRYSRWTIWTSPRVFAAADDYVAEKKRLLAAWDDTWTAARQAALEAKLAEHDEEQRRLGEVYRFLVGPCEWLTGLYHEVGLDQFVYFMTDYPDLVGELLEIAARETILWAEHLPADREFDAVFLADDLAYRSGPLFNPRWMERVYMPRLARIIDAFHRRNIQVLFHSDGNLWKILDGLVEAGIDALNPIEVMAGMDVGEIHRRYPKLLMAGGIDVSDLLVFGTPAAIRETVHRTIDAAEGRILVGSSTEVHDAVPLRNFLAMRDAVLEYRG
jgi:hypothetical protein